MLSHREVDATGRSDRGQCLTRVNLGVAGWEKGLTLRPPSKPTPGGTGVGRVGDSRLCNGPPFPPVSLKIYGSLSNNR